MLLFIALIFILEKILEKDIVPFTRKNKQYSAYKSQWAKHKCKQLIPFFDLN
jgi:hypothetical protein